MNRLILGMAVVIFSSSLFATEAILACRTSGIVHDTTNIISMPCGYDSDNCKDKLKEALKRKYGKSDSYDAMTKACDELPGSWYPDGVYLEY